MHLFKFRNILLCFIILIMVKCNRVNLQTTTVPDKENNVDVASYSSLDNSLFLQVHKSIILPNCALAACHDGNFEPDYRTPQSFYLTTVFHPIIKNSRDSLFTYRVVPYDTAKSVLIERITNCCFNDQNDRMPVLMQTLNQNQVDSISLWIMEGCPNYNNEFPWKKFSATE